MGDGGGNRSGPLPGVAGAAGALTTGSTAGLGASCFFTGVAMGAAFGASGFFSVAGSAVFFFLWLSDRSILPNILGVAILATSSLTLITPLLIITSFLKSAPSSEPFCSFSLRSSSETDSCFRFIFSRIFTFSMCLFPPNSLSRMAYAAGSMIELGELSTLIPFFSRNSIIVVCPTFNSLAT